MVEAPPGNAPLKPYQISHPPGIILDQARSRMQNAHWQLPKKPRFFEPFR